MLVRPNSVNGNDFGKKGRQAVVLNGGCKPLGRTVGEDSQWDALQSVQSLRHVWKCRRPEVRLHESVKFRIARLYLQ